MDYQPAYTFHPGDGEYRVVQCACGGSVQLGAGDMPHSGLFWACRNCGNFHAAMSLEEKAILERRPSLMDPGPVPA